MLCVAIVKWVKHGCQGSHDLSLTVICGIFLRELKFICCKHVKCKISILIGNNAHTVFNLRISKIPLDLATLHEIYQAGASKITVSVVNVIVRLVNNSKS